MRETKVLSIFMYSTTLCIHVYPNVCSTCVSQYIKHIFPLSAHVLSLNTFRICTGSAIAHLRKQLTVAVRLWTRDFTLKTLLIKSSSIQVPPNKGFLLEALCSKSMWWHKWSLGLVRHIFFPACTACDAKPTYVFINKSPMISFCSCSSGSRNHPAPWSSFSHASADHRTVARSWSPGPPVYVMLTPLCCW